MKYIIVLCDGMSDHAQDILNGLTPMEAAVKPNLDSLAGKSEMGLFWPGVPELPMGSDVGNLTVLGYDPRENYSGRAPFEAANLGIELGKSDTVFRCNLVSIKDEQMFDYSAGHIPTEDARDLIKMLDTRLGNKKLKFYSGTQYRHLAVFTGAGFEAAKCTPPHEISGQPIEKFLPKGNKGGEIRKLMEDSRFLLEGHEVNRERRREGKAPANMIWLWGQGKSITLPSFRQRTGLNGAVISAVDLIKGIGKILDMNIIQVPGCTGWLDTNFEGKAQGALKALKKHDLVYIHIEATDEAGHMGDVAAKVKAIEEIDAKVIKTLIDGLQGEEYRLLVCPDHSTPLATRGHLLEPVPFMIYDSTVAVTGEHKKSFSEKQASVSGIVLKEGWTLMDKFILNKTGGN
jgi:2,3-bisphosphoglycerate-independent phosphoglycerate mutase